jgi:hypothetical protein
VHDNEQLRWHFLAFTRANLPCGICVCVQVLGNRTSLRRQRFTVPQQYKMGNVDVASEQPTAADAATGVDDRAAYVNSLYEQVLRHTHTPLTHGDVGLVVKPAAEHSRCRALAVGGL